MRSTMVFATLAIVTVTEVFAGTHSSDYYYWQKQVKSDKEQLSSAMSDMEGVAQDYQKASQNNSHAMTLSLNLAEKAFNSAHSHASSDKENAISDFNNALSTLKSSSATGNSKDAEKAVRQKSEEVDKVERREAEDAKRRLRTQRKQEDGKVTHTFNKAQDSANKLLKDRSHLEKAARNSGKSEQDYERMSEQLEQHAERQRDYAENNKDRASHAIEKVFEGAQDHLEDREQRLKDRSTDEREKAIDEAVSLVRSLQAAQASQSSSAINLYAKSGNNVHHDKEEKRKNEEQHWQQKVESEKSKLSTSMKNLDKVATGFRYSAENKTHAEALAANIAQGVFNEAAANKKDEKERAAGDFNKYLSNLNSASPTDHRAMSHARRTVEDQARYLDKLDDEENKDAKKSLQSKHKSQKDEVKGSYRDAHRAAMDLLHDKDHLERAMRAAGRKEREYEGQQEDNEYMAESQEDKAEDLNDEANGAAARIYRMAKRNLHVLQHSNRKEQHAAAHARQQQIHDAMMTLKSAREGKVYHAKMEKRGDNTDENESELTKIQDQMENLAKGKPPKATASEASEEMLVVPAAFSSSCVLAVGPLGLLLFFYVRRARTTPPTPVVQPLLG